MRQQITSRAQSALTPDGLAATLEQGSSKGVQGTVADAGASLAQQAVDNGLRQLESRLSRRFFRTINLNWSPGFNGREEIFQLDSVMSFHDGERGALLSQLGVQGRDGEVGGNAGLMLRSRGFEQMTFGLNAFYDYLSDPDVDRWSVGAEALGRYFSFSGNIYTGISEDTTANGVHYSPDGWDVEVAGVMPSFPWVELSGRHYHWDRQGQDDLKGQDYKLTLKPVPLVAMSLRYDDSSGSTGGGSDIGLEFNLSYRMGRSLTEQLQGKNDLGVGIDPWERRFERVRREYEQRVQRRGAGGTTTGAMATTPSCPGGGSSCRVTISNVQVPSGAATVVVTVSRPGVGPSLGSASGGGSGLLRTARNCRVEGLPGATCDFDGTGAITVNLGNVGAGGGERYDFNVSFRNSGGIPIVGSGFNTNTTLPTRTAGGISYSMPVISVNEGGSTTYTVVLNAAPTGTPPEVTVTLTSTDPSAVTVAGPGMTAAAITTLTFTTSGATIWSTPQTVTVTGVEDDSDTDSETLRITYTASGGGYDNLAPDPQQVVVSDNDGASVITTAPPVMPLTEGGATGSYSLSLNTEPTGTVTIRPASSDISSVTVSPAMLEFTTTNYATPQPVTVTAVDDPDADGETVSIGHVISGGGYDSVTLAAQRVMVTDAGETVGITASTGGASIAVGEGSTNTYTLELNTQPTATVTIALASSNTAAVRVSPASLTFTTVTDPAPASATTNGWNVAQTVTLTGVEDDSNSASETVMISYTVSGGDYQGFSLTSQTVTTTDNDIPGVTYNPTSLTVTEGGTGSYTVVLNTPPTATVTVAISSSAGNTLSVTSGSSLTFTTSDWSTPQTVMVRSAVNSVTSDTPFTLSHSLTSTDTGYDGRSVPDQTVSVTDVTLRVTSFTATGGNGLATLSWTNPAGATRALVSAFVSGTLVDISDGSLNDPADGTNVLNLTASPGMSTTTITGLANGTTYEFVIVPQDSAGNVGTSPSVTATPAAPGVISSEPGNVMVTEGGSGSYTLRLATQPTHDVMVAIASDMDMVAAPDPAMLTFTNGNWSTTQTVMVRSPANSVTTNATVSLSYTLISSDPNYGGATVTAQSVSVTDVTVATVTGFSATPGNAQAVLAWTNPTGGVGVRISARDSSNNAVDISGSASDGTNDHVISTGSPTNYTVTGLSNGTQYTFSIYARDGSGNESAAATDMATPAEAPGLTYNPTSLTVTEGGTGSYMVSLNIAPTATVTVAVAPHGANASLLTVTSGASLMFTTTNWNTPQTVMVSSAANMVRSNTDVTLRHTITSSDTGYSSLSPVDQTVTVTDVTRPAPRDVTATGGNAQAALSWTNPSWATSVRIRATANGSAVDISGSASDGTDDLVLTITSGMPTSTTITGLTNGAEFLFFISARDSAGNEGSEGRSQAVTPIDPNAPLVEIDFNRNTITEGGDDATITATLRNPPSGDVTLTLTVGVVPIFNADTTDYTLSATTLTLNSGTATGTITATAVDDNIDEVTEFLRINFSAVDASSANVQVSLARLSLRIRDND